MKKHYLIYLGIIVLMLITIWVCYKCYLLTYYRTNGVPKNLQKISVTTNRNLANTTFHDMNLYIPSDLVIANTSSEDSRVYCLETSEPQIFLAKGTSNLKQMENLNLDTEELMTKYSIKDESDILTYYSKHINNKRNIFWSKSKIEMHYLAFAYMDLLPYSDEQIDISYFQNEISGYILYDPPNYIYITIFKDDEKYTLNFNKETFTTLEVNSILQSIYFN